MLIHVHPSAVDLAVRGDEHARNALENILRAHREAKHVASLDSSAASALIQLARLSEDARGTLRDIQGRRPMISGLRKVVPVFLEVVDPGAEITASQRPHQRILRADVRLFHDSGTTQKAVLVAENQTDAEWYVLLGKTRIAERQWSHVDVVFQKRSGGGAELAREFDMAAREGNIVLAIADSDQKSAQSAYGDTWKRLRDATTGKPDYQLGLALHVRMAENLIPTKLLLDALPDANTQNRIRLLEKLEENIPPHFRAHADLKNGVSLRWIRQKLNPRAKEGEYWLGVEEAIRENPDLRAWTCDAPIDCDDEKKKCQCFVIPHIGAKTLEAVVRYVRDHITQASSYFDFPRDPKLGELCDNILSWGCALGWHVRT